jgi:hypothetical protein
MVTEENSTQEFFVVLVVFVCIVTAVGPSNYAAAIQKTPSAMEATAISTAAA